MSFAAAMLFALGLDALLGWPEAIYRRIGHPVTWLGALITQLDRRLNRNGAGAARRQIMGGVTVALVVAAAVLPALTVHLVLPGGWLLVICLAVLAWPLLAVRSMYDHVAAVATPLVAGDIDAARAAVAMIVGRDPAQLEREGIARAALESLAENTSDGIVAPLFWGVLLGLPGIAAYKAINTMDSMIGHRTLRHEDFGKAAARLDDLVNWVPARLTGLIFVAVAPHPKSAWQVMRKDAAHHRSPNAGWPEGAMAGGLGVRLSGPRVYGAHVSKEPWLNAGAPDPLPVTVQRGLALYLRGMILVAVVLGLLAAI